MATPHPIRTAHNFIDLTGHPPFDRLSILSRAPNIGTRGAWHVQCVCGNFAIVLGENLRNGRTKSCGCLQREIISKANTTPRKREIISKTFLTHGATVGRKETPTYKSWQNMRRRCLNSHDPKFPNYGGRGITICVRWQSFAHFLADMGERPPGPYSLERKNNNKGYFPKNCRWATPKEQSNNTRNTVRLTYHGITLPLTQWAERIGMKRSCLWSRKQRGWDDERALTTKTLIQFARTVQR